MRERITHLALALWTAILVGAVLGYGSLFLTVIGIIAGTVYLMGGNHGLQAVRNSRSPR